MIKKRLTASRGFTLIELMIAMAVTIIVVLAIGIALVDGQRGWNIQYDRIYSDVVTDGYVARRKFDAVMRTASRDKLLFDDAGSWVEVYYYADDTSTVVDRYARFYAANGQLSIEHGSLAHREILTTSIICGNVQGCVFKAAGRSAQMILTLDNGSQTANVVSSAVMHNK